jgi:hypothetical protein
MGKQEPPEGGATAGTRRPTESDRPNAVQNLTAFRATGIT